MSTEVVGTALGALGSVISLWGFITYVTLCFINYNVKRVVTLLEAAKKE